MSDKYQTLREAARKATPGPWSRDYRRIENGMRAEEVLDSSGEPIARLAWHPVRMGGGITKTDREENSRYIAASNPTTIQALLAERDALRVALQMMVHMIEQLAPHLQGKVYDHARAALTK